MYVWELLQNFNRVIKRKIKIKKLFNFDIVENLIEPGYIYVPYLTTKDYTQVNDYSKKISRKRKINNIFNLGLDDEFSPIKSISSRYSKTMVNSRNYTTIEIIKPTY